MTSRPHVLLVGPDPADPARQGGVAACIGYLLESPLARLSRLQPCFLDSRSVNRLPLPRPLKRLLSVSALSVRLLVGRKGRDCVAHVHSSLYPKAVYRDLAVLIPLALRGIPVLLQYHGGRVENLRRSRWLWKLWKWQVGRLCATVACFPGPQRDELGSVLGGKIRSVVNMVPLPEKTPAKTLEGSTHFLFLGRVTREKGVFTLLSAFAALRRDLSDVRLTIAGDGRDRDACLREAKELGLKVEFPGRVQGTAKSSLIAAADVYVLPSEAEGLPLSALECGASGRALILTSNCGLISLFEDGKECLFVRPEDSLGLLQAMKRLALDPSGCRELGQRARSRIQRDFSMETVSHLFLNLYRQLSSEP